MQARSLLFDLWGDYIQHVGGEAWTSTLARYLAEFGINEPALRQALSRMTRQGWVEVRKVAARSCYSLTDRGKKRMAEACRRVYNPIDHPWNGRWLVLCYSIPTDMRAIRDDLRTELSWTGLAPLTPGTWISPNPLEEALDELIKRYDIGQCVKLFRASLVGSETPQALVARCWDLAGIQAGYDRFIAQWEPTLQVIGLPDVQCFVTRIELVHDYRKFLFVDPGLPRELLPDQWRGHDARRLFQELYGLLEPGARRFMDGAFEPTR